MKKNYIILFFLTMTVCTLSAQVIVSEDFDYTLGSNLGGANSGVGWGGAWEALATERTIIDDTLRNYRTGKASGTYIDLSVTSANENLRYQRALSTPITDDGNEYWLAFTMDVETTGGNVANLILQDDTDGFKFIIGRVGSGALAVGAPGSFQNVNGVSPNQLNWLVAKITFTGDAVEDTVRLFVNPDPLVEPTDDMAGATYAGGIMNSGTINSVLIRAENATSITASFDDIYLGNSYADIVPTSAKDIPLYAPVKETFDYAAASNISGQGTASDGWGGSWELTTGANQVIVEDSVSIQSLLRSTRGNALLFDNALGETRLTRSLSQTYEDNGLTYWFSYFGDFEGADASDLMLPMLINNGTETMGAGGPGGQFAASGKWDGAFQFGVGKFSGGFAKDVTTLIEDGAHWLVMSVETTGNADADTLRLFLDPDPGSEPLIGEEVAKFWSTRLNDGWQAIGIKNSAGSLKTTIDDIYLGIEYADVVPEDLAIIDVAPTVAFEKFEYTVGGGLSGNGGTENGWAGPWELIDEPEHTIIGNGILNNDLLTLTTGNALLMDATVGESRYARPLANSYEDNGRTYWMSFFGDFEGAEGADLINVMLIDNASEEMGASGPNGQFVAVGKWDAAFQFGLGKFSGGFNKSPDNITVASDTSLWFVVSVETNGTSDGDTVRLYLNPDPGVEPVKGEEDVKYTVSTLNGGWRGIGIKNGSGLVKASIDDIYLGNSFSDVIPGDLISVVIPEPAFESFDYAAGTISGAGGSENGWGGPWQILSGPEPNIVEDSITNIDVFRQTLPNALNIDATAGATRMFRPLESTYGDNGLTYWLSFFAEFNNTTDNGVTTVMLVNNDTESLEASGGNGQFVAIGKWTSAGSLAIGSFGPFGQSVATDVAEGTHWLVARIETNATTDRDTVRLFLNPDPNVEPTVGQEILKFAASELNGGWQAIGIKNDAGVSNSLIDDIYLGTSYTDIVPGDLVNIESLFTAGSTYEGFDYTATAQLENFGDRSDGWADGWQRTNGDSILLEANSITSDFTNPTGNKALINYTIDTVQYDRELSGRFEDDGSTVWMSFLIDFQNATSINTEAKVVLMDGTEEKIGFGRTAGFNRIGLIWDPEIFEFITESDAEGTNWIVVRIDFSGDDNPEDFHMWIDPIPEIQPATNQADLIVNADSENRLAMNSGFDGVRITASGGPSITFAIDELRLGYNYADVTSIQEEIPEELIAREQFRYPSGESLLGLGSSGDQWAGPWEFGAGGGGPASIDAGNLSLSGLSGKDNSTTLLAGTGVGPGIFSRRLATPITDDGNTYWFSFIGRANQNVGQGGFGDASGDNLVLFGKRNPDVEASIHDIGGDGDFVKTAVNASQVNWYVAKVIFSGDAEADSVLLWMNPDPEVIPDPNFPDAVLEVNSLNDGIASVYFRTAGGVTELSIDEIHLGTTFESIVPLGDVGGEGPLGLDDVTDFINYPNPFVDLTTFHFLLEQREQVQLSILDLNGKEVLRILDGQQAKGEHKITWDGTGKDGNKLSTGMYLYRFAQGGKFKIGRLILLDK
ncbi:FlgD immunoglobulin-like domain containing protein [Ekhidna sp.]